MWRSTDPEDRLVTAVGEPRGDESQLPRPELVEGQASGKLR
jgi:hypothetical protein